MKDDFFEKAQVTAREMAKIRDDRIKDVIRSVTEALDMYQLVAVWRTGDEE